MGSNNVEIVCVNDGSTDKSGEILSELAAQYHQLRVFYQDNQGAAAARKSGILHAKGEYLAFCDSDDYVEACWLSGLFERLKNNNADISVCRAIIEGLNIEYKPSEVQIWTREILPLLFIDHSVFNGSLVVKLFKKSLFDNVVHDKRLKYFEDANLIWQMIRKQRIKTVVRCNEGAYHYVYNNDSMTHQTINHVRIYSVIKFWKMVYNDCCQYEHLCQFKYQAMAKLISSCTSIYLSMLREGYKNQRYEELIHRIIGSFGVKGLMSQRGLAKIVFTASIAISTTITKGGFNFYKMFNFRRLI